MAGSLGESYTAPGARPWTGLRCCIGILRNLGLAIACVGLEAGPLSQWPHNGSKAAGLDAVLLETSETRHVKAARQRCRSRRTDAARGIARLPRMGWFRPIAPPVEALARVAGLLGLEQTLRRLPRGFGLEAGDVGSGKLPVRIRELTAACAMLERVVEPMLAGHAAMWREFTNLHREVLAIIKEDQVCRRLKAALGVGTVMSLTYKAAADDSEQC